MRKNNLKSKPQGPFRIAIYTRVSSEEQAENPEGSIKNQEQRLREYVKLKNMVEPFGEIVDVFSDPGVSAKDMNRPGFQKMLKKIERQEIDLVLVTELSRFSRSTKDFALLQEFLEEKSCKFMSIRENFDTSGAAGAMVLNLMASIAEFERRQTGERISHSFLARAKRGLYNGGSVPLGFKVDSEKPGILIPVPEEVEIVKTLFRTFIKEGSLAAASKALNEMKIQIPRRVWGGGSVRGKHIRYDSVYRVLKNKAYIGRRVFLKNGEVEEVKAQWEGIIDEATFYRVQKMLKNNCSRRKTHKNKFPFTLSGILECKECGEKMSGASATGGTGKRVGYYEHLATKKSEASIHHKLLSHKPRRIPAGKIEPLVWIEVKRFVTSNEFAKDLLARASESQGQNEQETREKTLEEKLRKVQRQITVLAERIANLPEAISADPLLSQLEEFQKNQIQISKELRGISSEDIQNHKIVEMEDFELFRKGLLDLLGKAEIDFDLRSKIIRLVVHKVEIMVDGFEIYFHVGETHFKMALGKEPSASFFVSFLRNHGAKNKKPSLGVPGEGLKLNSGQSAKNQMCERSTRLTNGGPNQNRTGDSTMPLSYDPNFTMGPSGFEFQKSQDFGELLSDRFSEVKSAGVLG